MLRLRTEVATKSIGGGKGLHGRCWQQLEPSTSPCARQARVWDKLPRKVIAFEVLGLAFEVLGLAFFLGSFYQIRGARLQC
jgi:hypothetical protein